MDRIVERCRWQFIGVVGAGRNGGARYCYGWTAAVAVALGFIGAEPDFRLVCVGVLWVGLVSSCWFFHHRVGAMVADAGGPLVDLGSGGATGQRPSLVALRAGLAAIPFRHFADVNHSAVF